MSYFQKVKLALRSPFRRYVRSQLSSQIGAGTKKTERTPGEVFQLESLRLDARIKSIVLTCVALIALFAKAARKQI